MKTIKTIGFVALSLLFVVACGKKQQQPVSEEHVILVEPSIFDANDSATVSDLANEYLNCFNAKDYQSAASMLFKLENDSIRQLTAAERQSYISTMRHFPNYGTRYMGVIFHSETNNKLNFLLQVTKNGDLMKETGIMRFSLNPVRRDGQWYLTLYESEE